jgi:hypothetical protein
LNIIRILFIAFILQTCYLKVLGQIPNEIIVQKLECFKNGSNWYFVDSNLHKINNTHFDSISLQISNNFIVRKKRKFALFNNKGIAVTKFSYSSIQPIMSELYDTISFCAQRKGNLYNINLIGIETTFIKEENIYRCRGPYSYMNSIMARKVKGGYRLNNRFGIDFSIPRDSQGKKENNFWHLVNGEFINVIDIAFDSLIHRQLYYGSTIRHDAVVYKDGKCGYIDIDGILKTEIKYKQINPINYEYIWVVVSDVKQGWYNLKTKKELFE